MGEKETKNFANHVALSCICSRVFFVVGLMLHHISWFKGDADRGRPFFFEKRVFGEVA